MPPHPAHPPSRPPGLGRTLRAALLTLATAGPALALAQPGGPHELRINVRGLQSAQGQAVARLYREGDDLFGAPREQATAPIANLGAQLVFKALEPGRYAVMVFHDVNGNGQLDHNLLHLPAEPLGFSNGFQLGLLSGKPDTHKLAFTLGADDLSLDITVR